MPAGSLAEANYEAAVHLSVIRDPRHLHEHPYIINLPSLRKLTTPRYNTIAGSLTLPFDRETTRRSLLSLWGFSDAVLSVMMDK